MFFNVRTPPLHEPIIFPLYDRGEEKESGVAGVRVLLPRTKKIAAHLRRTQRTGYLARAVQFAGVQKPQQSFFGF